MSAATPNNPPTSIATTTRNTTGRSLAGLAQGARTTPRLLRAYGFHLLAVILGIALAFM